MSIADIIPAPAVRSIVALALDEIWRGRRALAHAFGSAPGANAPMPGLSYALTRARRLLRLMRYAFLIVAAWFDIDLPRRRVRAQRRGAATSSRGDAARLVLGRPWRARDWDDPVGMQPPQFCYAHRDPAQTMARYLSAIAAAMLDPTPHVRRLARRLRRGDIFLLRRQPRRPPRTGCRHHLDYLDETRAHLFFELRQRRWALREDSS